MFESQEVLHTAGISDTGVAFGLTFVMVPKHDAQHAVTVLESLDLTCSTSGVHP